MPAPILAEIEGNNAPCLAVIALLAIANSCNVILRSWLFCSAVSISDRSTESWKKSRQAGDTVTLLSLDIEASEAFSVSLGRVVACGVLHAPVQRSVASPTAR